jgi:hypothetical protein
MRASCAREVERAWFVPHAWSWRRPRPFGVGVAVPATGPLLASDANARLEACPITALSRTRRGSTGSFARRGSVLRSDPEPP